MGEIPFVGGNKVDFLNLARTLGTVVRFPADSKIFKEGDTPDNMYIVLSGAIEVRGRDKLIEKLEAGDSLGIVGLMDEKPRTITAHVVEDVELALIDKRRFRYMVESVPNYVWYVMNELAGRLRATNAAL
jgi:CRP/FNR family transcriptional regulator, cyclic AMP receptor protein